MVGVEDGESMYKKWYFEVEIDLCENLGCSPNTNITPHIYIVRGRCCCVKEIWVSLFCDTANVFRVDFLLVLPCLNKYRKYFRSDF